MTEAPPNVTHGQFAGEGVFAEPFCAALEDGTRRDRTTLGEVVDAARAAVKRTPGVDQEPELANGERDLVLRDVSSLGLEVEAWEAPSPTGGPGRKLDGATVVLGERRITTPGAFTGLRPGLLSLTVTHAEHAARTVEVELGPDRSG